MELLDQLLPRGVDLHDVATVVHLSSEDALALVRELLACLDEPRSDLATALSLLERHAV